MIQRNVCPERICGSSQTVWQAYGNGQGVGHNFGVRIVGLLGNVLGSCSMTICSTETTQSWISNPLPFLYSLKPRQTNKLTRTRLTTPCFPTSKATVIAKNSPKESQPRSVNSLAVSNFTETHTANHDRNAGGNYCQRTRCASGLLLPKSSRWFDHFERRTETNILKTN